MPAGPVLSTWSVNHRRDKLRFRQLVLLVGTEWQLVLVSSSRLPLILAGTKLWNSAEYEQMLMPHAVRHHVP